MDNVFIAKGHGYEKGEYGRCTAFDGYEVIAAPLHQPGEGWEAAFGKEARESRVFGRKENGNGGCCYGSHAIKLARAPHGQEMYILMQHGGGREVLRVPTFYDCGALAESILAMPERLQYALLYTIYKTAAFARSQAQAETRQVWAQAFVDGRIKRRRATKTRAARIEIEQGV